MTKKIKYKDITKKIQLVIEHVTRIKSLRIEVFDMIDSDVSGDSKDRAECLYYYAKLMKLFKGECEND